MKKHQYALQFWFAIGALLAAALPSWAGVISKADNADALNLGTSWVGDTAPGANDVATWDAALTAGKTYSLGADLSWLGLAVPTDPGENMAFNSGNTLTLGREGINSSPNRTITLNNPITLGADQTWKNSSGLIIPAGGVNTAGHALTLVGQTKQFKGAITGSGDLIIRQGTSATVKFSNGTVATDSDIYVSNCSKLQFDATPASGGAARAANITLRGAGAYDWYTRAELISSGVNSANTVDAIAGALTIDAGHATVTAQPNASRPLRITANSLSRNQGGLVLFRGTDLGVSTIASSTPGDANISLTTMPTLLGGGGAGGTTTISILPGAHGDIIANGNGTGLVTYDTNYGIRLLDIVTEFTNVITSGQTQLDNVRYANTSGSGIISTILSQDTTINSLSFEESGAGTGTGISIAGDDPARQLTLNSGMVFARQNVTTANATDSMVISNLVLNLNGKEGVFTCWANGLNQGNTPAPLKIYGDITNDGGNGVTFGGIGDKSGQIILFGSTVNTYTGPTILNSGFLLLNKSVPNIGIPGNLIINGGNLIKNVEAIPDTGDVTLNGGAFTFDNTTSSGNNGHYETINNLYMNGGTINFNSGKNHWFTINGNAVVNAKDLQLNLGGDVTVLGTTTLNGGRVLVSLSDSTTTINAFFSLNDVVITNQASGVYSPIVLKSSGTSAGGQLTLKGNLTFVGNSINENPTLIDSENIALAKQGVIAFDGMRTFDIGNGAAPVDVQVNVAIADNGATAGGLTKSGAGTLALNGTNTFTGGTTVNVGTLTGNGSLASDLTVASGATLAPGTPDAVGTFTVNADVAFTSDSILDIDISGATADLLKVTGSVTGTVSVPVAQDQADGEWLVMTADAFDAEFLSTNPRFALYTRNGGTELWLTRTLGTAIIIK